jgi:S-adenosylmethionine hydrolase
MPIISLLTDFGYQDEYVGVLKGVIYRFNPAATIVDLTHGIAAQDVAQAAHVLAAAYPYFPEGSIHVVVVDPGVGSQRAVIAVRQEGHLFLAPDNGVLSVIWRDLRPRQVVRVENPAFFLPSLSQTFHGRDIFAPVAAHLSLGVALSQLGPQRDFEDLIQLPLAQASYLHSRLLEGQVVGVDHFGNLATNLSLRHIEKLRSAASRLVIQIAGRCIDDLSTHYGQVDSGRLLALINSRNCLEIALANGNAAAELHAGVGTPVHVSAEAFL